MSNETAAARGPHVGSVDTTFIVKNEQGDDLENNDDREVRWKPMTGHELLFVFDVSKFEEQLQNVSLKPREPDLVRTLKKAVVNSHVEVPYQVKARPLDQYGRPQPGVGDVPVNGVAGPPRIRVRVPVVPPHH